MFQTSGFGPTTAKVERTRRLKLAACFGLASVFAVAAEDAYPPAVVSAGKAVYQIVVPGSRGTGFFIAPNRLATNFHVVDSIQDMGDVSLHFDNEPSPIRATRLLAVSCPYDLALLETEGSPAVHLSAGGSPQGTAYTIGYPDRPPETAGQRVTSDLQYHHSVSGVTALDAQYEGIFNFGKGPGSSGSPVLDSQGRFFAVLFAADEMDGATSNKSFVDARWLAQLANGREGTLCQDSAEACLEHEVSRAEGLARRVLLGQPMERESLGVDPGGDGSCWSFLGESGHRDFLERMAMDFNDGGAQYGLGILHRDEGDLEKAFEWLGAAAEGGVPLAQYNLGVLYDEQDEWEKAARWYKSAAELGVPDAQYNLSEMYRYGEGVEWNDELADYWMAKCSEAKGADCSCEETGEGSECSK